MLWFVLDTHIRKLSLAMLAVKDSLSNHEMLAPRTG